MDVTRILGVITKSGSMLVGVPEPGGGMRIGRCRITGAAAKAMATFEGTMVSVDPANGEAESEPTYTCGDRRFRGIEGSFGEPIVGKRLYAGRPDGYHEVTSPVVEVFWMDRDREWVIPILMHTYRAQREGFSPSAKPGSERDTPLEDWRIHLIEQPFEEGFEGIEDDCTLTRSMRRRYELAFLGVLARRRTTSALDIRSQDQRDDFARPNVRCVPKRDLDAALLEAAGPGTTEGRMERKRRKRQGRSVPVTRLVVPGEHRGNLVATLDAYECLLSAALDRLAPPASDEPKALKEVA